MRTGYGYDRAEKDFAHVNVDRVYLDFSGSGRVERGQLLAPGVLRPGDTVVLLDARDLGAKATKAVEAAGLSIEVCDPPPQPARVGKPPKFDPDPEQDAKIRALWLNPGYTLQYIKDRAAEIMGEPVERHQLVYRYKNRHKR